MTNYPCPICERVFSHRSSLRNHVKTHENIVDRVLREISEDTRQEDAAPGGEQQFGQEETPVFGDEQRGDEQREEEEQEFEEEEQEFEEENPEEEGYSSHSSLSLDSERQEEAEDAVIISYLIYTKIDKLYIDKLSMYSLINYLCTITIGCDRRNRK